MKLAAFLLIVAVLLAVIAPRLGELFSGVGVRLPQFIWSKTPPRVYQINFTNASRAISIILFISAAVVLILSWRSHK